MRKSIKQALQPSVAILGFALFLAINAASVWGGVFPFLPLENQTHELLFWFYFAQSVSFFAMFLICARLVYVSHVQRIFMLTTSGASTSYGLGWICLIASIYAYDFALPLLIVAGVLLGGGAAEFYLLWQRYFASTEPDRGTRAMIAGAVYAAIIYAALYLIPRAVTAFLIPVVFLPLFGLALTLKNREIDFAQPMFMDSPRENRRVYARLIRGTMRATLAIGALAFCAGIMRALAIDNPSIGSLVNILSMLGMLAAASVLLYFWRARGLNLSITRLYRVVFPLVITALVIVPLCPEGYMRWLAAGLYALYAIATLLVMLQTAQIARDQGIHPVYAFGSIGGIVYAMHDMGFLIGSAGDQMALSGTDPIIFTTVVTIYLLALMFFVSTIDFKKEQADMFSDDHIELITPRSPRLPAPQTASQDAAQEIEATPPMEQAKAEPAGDLSDFSQPSTTSNGWRDRIDKQAKLLQRDFGLSNREAEVVKLVCQGNTVPSISEQLYISENTVRTHMKRLYTKLGIHKKQELIDLAHSYKTK